MGRVRWSGRLTATTIFAVALVLTAAVLLVIGLSLRNNPCIFAGLAASFTASVLLRVQRFRALRGGREPRR